MREELIQVKKRVEEILTTFDTPYFESNREQLTGMILGFYAEGHNNALKMVEDDVYEYRDSLPQFDANEQLDEYYNAQVNASQNIINNIQKLKI
jgi:hypothetical protein